MPALNRVLAWSKPFRAILAAEWPYLCAPHRHDEASLGLTLLSWSRLVIEPDTAGGLTVRNAEANFQLWATKCKPPIFGVQVVVCTKCLDAVWDSDDRVGVYLKALAAAAKLTLGKALPYCRAGGAS